MSKEKNEQEKNESRYKVIVNPRSEFDWNQSTNKFTAESIDSRDHLASLESPKKQILFYYSADKGEGDTAVLYA